VARGAASLLFGVTPTDPLTYLSVTAAVVATALVMATCQADGARGPEQAATRLGPWKLKSARRYAAHLAHGGEPPPHEVGRQLDV
jgi:hypothetical protein